MPEPCAIGLSVHTGWVACVIASGSVDAPRLVLRERIQILEDADRFVYHVAEQLPLARAERGVAKVRTLASERASAEIMRLVSAAREADCKPVACAIVAKRTPMPKSLAEIVAAHPRIHTAEGCFHRDVWAGAAKSRRLRTLIIPPNDAELTESLAAANRMLEKFGRPWGKDQKLAALAAWVALDA